MLLKIKFHPPTERPTYSCEAIVATKYHDLYSMPYSFDHGAWNVRDKDIDTDNAIDPKDYFIGWIYADEIFWQMVAASREENHEAE